MAEDSDARKGQPVARENPESRAESTVSPPIPSPPTGKIRIPTKPPVSSGAKPPTIPNLLPKIPAGPPTGNPRAAMLLSELKHLATPKPAGPKPIVETVWDDEDRESVGGIAEVPKPPPPTSVITTIQGTGVAASNDDSLRIQLEPTSDLEIAPKSTLPGLAVATPEPQTTFDEIDESELDDLDSIAPAVSAPSIGSTATVEAPLIAPPVVSIPHAPSQPAMGQMLAMAEPEPLTSVVPPPVAHVALNTQQLAVGSNPHGDEEISVTSAPAFVTETTPVPKLLDVPAPRRLGSYEILRSIGSGGMAEVFLARRDGLMGFEKHVALKCIHPHLTLEAHFVTMFFDEARLAAKIHDPRVVQIYELGEANGTYYIAMEYLAGESLSALVKKGLRGGPALPPHLAARVIADVAGGLHAAHELRDANNVLLDVVHRDMSHGNVIVLYSGAVKVLDFGVAKARSSLTQTTAGERKGKYGYMSPEQIRGEVLDRRSDVFSLGVVLWETLTRKRLFAADSEPATMRRVLEGEPPPPSAMSPAVPAELDRIVLRALAKDRRDRFQTAEEMSIALEGYLHHAAVASGVSEVAAYMRAAFADRIESQNPNRRVTREGEPMPLADLKQTQVLTPTQMRTRSQRRKIAGYVALPILLVIAFLVGRRGGGGDQPVVAAKGVVVADAAVASVTGPTATDKSLIDSKLDIVDIAIRNGRIASPPGDNALEMLLDIEALDPTNARSKALRKQAIDKLLADAQVLWSANKQDSARNIYEDVLLFDPANAIALQRRKSADPRQAPKTKADLAMANPDEIPWLVSQIDLAIIERRLLEPPGHNALEYLQQLRKIDPKNTAGHRLSAEVASALTTEAIGKPETTKRELIAAAKAVTGGKEPGAGSGSAAKPTGSEANDKSTDKARDPKLASEWVQKGNAQLGSGHLAEARRAFERAIVADSGAHGALAGLAEVAYNESDYTRAVLAAKRAVMLAPGATAYRMSLAKSYYKLLRYDDAIKQWKKVIELDAKSPFAGSAQKNIEMAQRKMGGG